MEAIKKICLLAILSVILLLTPCQGRTVVEIKLEKFDSKGKDSNGENCDPAILGDTVKRCDPMFQFCMDKKSGNSNPDNCEYLKKKSSYYTDENVVRFNHNIKGVDNPLKKTISNYQGIRFKVEVIDKDDVTDDDDLDKFDWKFNYTPAKNRNEAKNEEKRKKRLKGKRDENPSELKLYVLVYCDDHYYGDDCRTHCEDNDNSDGHWRCSNRGEKICLPGWSGRNCRNPDCSTVECGTGGQCVLRDNTFDCICETEISNDQSDRRAWWTDCGLSKYCDVATAQRTRIIGGEDARPHEFPWQVRLRIWTSLFGRALCGGTIIHPLWILTAAHCVDEVYTLLDLTFVEVHVGEHDMDDETDGAGRIWADEIFIHQNYRNEVDLLKNDIALIKLQNAINFTVDVRPACGPDGRSYSGDTAYASGWGVTDGDDRGSHPSILQYMATKIQSNNGCQEDWNGIRIRDSMICTKYDNNRDRSTCYGDSGGSLVTRPYSRFQVVGIPSFVTPGCTGAPNVYTRVSHFRDWIQQTMSENTPEDF